jgi:hypothetical protein
MQSDNKYRKAEEGPVGQSAPASADYLAGKALDAAKSVFIVASGG